MNTCTARRPLALRLKYFVEEHWRTTRQVRAFIMRNLDWFATLAALIVLAVMEHVTRVHPPI